MTTRLSPIARPLQIVCSVVEHGSLSRAAEALQLTQGGVSQAIQSVEEEVGIQIFDRSRRPLGLTPAGEVFVEGVRAALDSLQLCTGQARRVQEDRGCQIRIAAIVSAGLTYLPDATERFAAQHPDVEIQTIYGTSERVADLVRERRADVGLVSFSKNTRDTLTEPWQEEPMRIICSDRHPLAGRHEVSVADLSGIEMIGFDRSLRIRQQVDRVLSSAGIAVSFPMEFDNTDSMIRAIQATGGIGILPEAAVRRETADGRLRVLACRDFRMSRPLGILRRRGDRLSEAAAAFVALLLGRRVEDRSTTGRSRRSRRDRDADDRVSVLA